MDLDAVREALADAGIDGWLFQDFRGSDEVGRGMLGIPEGKLGTRRWFYWIPARGEPVRLVHRIEPGALDDLAGEKVVYLSWRELEASLGTLLAGASRVAMQYSPGNAIPTVSRVDAGTVEMVRAHGVDVVSSADLVQLFEARWSDAQYASHVRAADVLRRLVDETFATVARRLADGEAVDEFGVKTFMLERMAAQGIWTDHGPIVGVNAHAGDPHYDPTPESALPIRRGDFLLLDVFGREEPPEGVFADITWTGVLAESPTARQVEIFEIVRDARDAGIEAVREAYRAGRDIRGFEVDDAVRDVIARAGYGEYFTHRTGHSIGRRGHGNGANVDNLETRDERRLIPRTCFSIEPGIYLEDFGVRSEVDVWIAADGTVEVTGGEPQRELIATG